MTLVLTLLVQGTVAGFAALLASRILHRHPPALRLTILLLGAASFVIPVPSLVAGGITPGERTLFLPTPLLVLIAFIYLGGLAVSLFRLLFESLAVRKIVAGTVAGPELADAPARILISDTIAVPFAANVNGPVIVLPSTVASEPAERLEAILLHEAAHLRYNDMRTCRWLAVFRALLWFHPVARALVRDARAAMEERCDDAVVRHASPLVYATALVDLASRLGDHGQPRAAMAMASAEVDALAARLERMAAPERQRSRILIPALIAVAFIAAAASAAPRIAIQHFHVHNHSH